MSNGYCYNYHKPRPISQTEAHKLLNPTKIELKRHQRNRVGSLAEDYMETQKEYKREE